MKYTELNLLNFVANEENASRIHDLARKFGVAIRCQSINADIEKTSAKLNKIKSTIVELELKKKNASAEKLGSFVAVDTFTSEDNIKLSNAYTRKLSTIETLKRLEGEREEVINEVASWYSVEGSLEEVITSNLVTFSTEFNTLHEVDKRTIEIISCVSYGVKLNMPTSMYGRLEMFYNWEVANGKVSGNPYVKEVKAELQNFLRTYSPIYNEEGTSEGLFIPKNMNINTTEVELFIRTYFKGSKIEKKTGNIVGNYANEKSVVGELNMLMLAKLQGMKYGYKVEKK